MTSQGGISNPCGCIFLCASETMIVFWKPPMYFVLGTSSLTSDESREARVNEQVGSTYCMRIRGVECKTYNGSRRLCSGVKGDVSR